MRLRPNNFAADKPVALAELARQRGCGPTPRRSGFGRAGVWASEARQKCRVGCANQSVGSQPRLTSSTLGLTQRLRFPSWRERRSLLSPHASPAEAKCCKHFDGEPGPLPVEFECHPDEVKIPPARLTPLRRGEGPGLGSDACASIARLGTRVEEVVNALLSNGQPRPRPNFAQRAKLAPG